MLLTCHVTGSTTVLSRQLKHFRCYRNRIGAKFQGNIFICRLALIAAEK